jgi:hypothetical protein
MKDTEHEISMRRMTDEGYELGQWRGFVQYCCVRCAFDTLRIGEMRAHIAKVHSLERAAVAVELPLVDHRGDPLVVMRPGSED